MEYIYIVVWVLLQVTTAGMALRGGGGGEENIGRKSVSSSIHFIDNWHVKADTNGFSWTGPPISLHFPGRVAAELQSESGAHGEPV